MADVIRQADPDKVPAALNDIAEFLRLATDSYRILERYIAVGSLIVSLLGELAPILFYQDALSKQSEGEWHLAFQSGSYPNTLKWAAKVEGHPGTYSDEPPFTYAKDSKWWYTSLKMGDPPRLRIENQRSLLVNKSATVVFSGHRGHHKRYDFTFREFEDADFLKLSVIVYKSADESATASSLVPSGSINPAPSMSRQTGPAATRRTASEFTMGTDASGTVGENPFSDDNAISIKSDDG